MIKLVFIDLDRTLLNSENNSLNISTSVIESLSIQQTIFVFSTKKSMTDSLLSLIKSLFERTNYYIITDKNIITKSTNICYSDIEKDAKTTDLTENDILKFIIKQEKIDSSEVLIITNNVDNLSTFDSKFITATSIDSPKILKDKADYFTKTINDEGIDYVLKKLVINNNLPKVLISSCLVGINCKYNGGNNRISNLEELKKKFDLVPVCPETFGGLETPRVPCEIINGEVFNKDMEDKTSNYLLGASKALKIAKLLNPKFIILKAKSPSCGSKLIYDGTFTNKLIPGSGVTTKLLRNNGFTVIDEEDIKKYL